MGKKPGREKSPSRTTASQRKARQATLRLFAEMDEALSRFWAKVEQQLGAEISDAFAGRFEVLFAYLRMHGYPTDLLDLKQSAIHAAIEAVRITRQQDVRSSRRRILSGTRNDERDGFIYDLAMKGVPWDAIVQAVFEQFGEKLARPTCVRGGNAFWKAHGLPEIPKRSKGRPKKTK